MDQTEEKLIVTVNQHVNKIKFHGVFLDSKLHWRSCVKYICGKLSKSIALMNRAKRTQ